jgi:hypothetical protein
VAIKAFDVGALRSDLDQLWAEAAAREARGVSIRLPTNLWSFEASEQDKRLAKDPFATVLSTKLGHIKEGRIRSIDVFEILNLHGAQLNQETYARVAEAMKMIGWRRPPQQCFVFYV